MSVAIVLSREQVEISVWWGGREGRERKGKDHGYQSSAHAAFNKAKAPASAIIPVRTDARAASKLAKAHDSDLPHQARYRLFVSRALPSERLCIDNAISSGRLHTTTTKS